jgi:Big-like domain-containing protein/phospholipase D-like protein
VARSREKWQGVLKVNRLLATSTVVAFCIVGFSAKGVHAQGAGTPVRGAGTYVCDIGYEDCREEVLTLIKNETVGIDVSFWFMTDARYSNAIVNQWNAGVPVRVIMDPRANTSKPANATQLQQLSNAGIPMLNKPFGDIAHWKGMIFASQNVVEFSGANYSPYEYVFEIPYVQYQDESIYFSNEPDVVQSLMRRFDDVWLNSLYTFYANAIPRVRSYPATYTIAPEFNLPPDDSYTDRLLPLLNAETRGIDVVMFRITDPRPADALIRAVGRGVPVRLYAEPLEYRNPARIEDSYNIDRMYMAGVHIKMRAHAGQNHQKTVRLVGQHTIVFGTSNWSTASDDNQLEVNYFTTKDWFYQFFANQFEWKWHNQPPDGSGAVQTSEFVPLPPDPPSYRAPANLATGVSPTSVTLKWYAGSWARKYDLYLGVGSNPVLHTADVQLGPSQSTSDYKSITITGLLPGTTYSWKVVSRTMANVTAEGALWSFTTSGTPPQDPPPPPSDTTAPSVVVYSPASLATVSGTIQIFASSADNVAVSGVRFKLDGVNLGDEDRSAPFTMPWDTASVADGQHTLTAQARDAAGNAATSSAVTVTVSNTGTPPPPPPPSDTTPPAVSVTAPSSGSMVTGATTISASASDNVGIAGVQFKLDGMNLGPEDTTAPYSVPWDTTSVANGTHTLTAQARDAAGNRTTSAVVSVTVSNPAPPPLPSGTIVLRAASVPVSNIFGNWVKSADSTAADAVALWNTDNGAAKISPALVAPQHYVDITFTAEAATAYHLWIRMRAQNDYYGNDSIHVQFSDAVDAAGSPIYRIGSGGADNSAQVVLQETDAGTISGWGWADQGWNGLGTQIYFATSGPHTLRIQQREDGAMFDQIVLSPDTFLTTAPGPQQRDDTIVPASPPPPPPSDTTPPSVAVSAPAEGSTAAGTMTISADSSDHVGVAGVQFQLDGVDIGAEDTIAPYSLSWDTTSAVNGTHTLTAQARDAAGNRTTSAAVSVTVSNPATPPPPSGTIVLRAADVSLENIFGNWIRSSDSTAADGLALWNTDNGAAKTAPALVAPQHYVDITFNAEAGTAYHLWIRMRAQNDYYGNDSIHVQFSDAVDAAGSAIYRIGSSGADNSAQVVLQETDGGTISGWGWADQGWNGLGTQIYFATSGPHTLRIQQREDGAMFDQVVLSPNTFLTTPPGPQKQDNTIVPRM